jgi:hypothetical protein
MYLPIDAMSCLMMCCTYAALGCRPLMEARIEQAAEEQQRLAA